MIPLYYRHGVWEDTRKIADFEKLQEEKYKDGIMEKKSFRQRVYIFWVCHLRSWGEHGKMSSLLYI